jgi:hypothetical protein
VPFAFVSAIMASALSLTGLKVADDVRIRLSRSGTKKNGRESIWLPGKIKNIITTLTVVMWVLYGTLACTMAAVSSVKAGEKKNITNILLPVLFLMLHVSYGAGTIVGLMDKQERG